MEKNQTSPSPKKSSHEPLAERMRPASLEEVIGQEHLLGEGKFLSGLLEKETLPSLILWGPPGVGKTTIASLMAARVGAFFVSLSAVHAGVKEVREVLEHAAVTLRMYAKRTVLFIDEIHRFNKAQQDSLLHAVEKGTVILIGATTENPSFEVNAALLSRTRVMVFHALSPEALGTLFDRTCADAQRGLGSERIALDEGVREACIAYAQGDARVLLTVLESAAALAVPEGEERRITHAVLAEALQGKMLRYDKNGEEHHNVISAFIKSMRNADSSAALYWLARMIEAGEDPLFIARRMVVFASEDVGLGDPHALILAENVFQAVHVLGMPEGRIPLAHCAVYLAHAPRNNSAYRGIDAALADVKTFGNLPVPLHLRNAPTQLMKELEYGKGYKYAHEYSDKKTDMQCMPDALKDKKYL